MASKSKPAKKKVVKKKPAKKKKTKKKAKKKSKITNKKNPWEPLKGNQYWKLRSKHGRSCIYESVDELWKACCAYFEWVEKNPLLEQKVFSNQGDVTFTTVTKMRAMTLKGLYLHIGLSNDTWANYRQKDDFLDIITLVENIIYEQKFTGAAADLLNANIISRELGLADKQEHSVAVAMIMDSQDTKA